MDANGMDANVMLDREPDVAEQTLREPAPTRQRPRLVAWAARVFADVAGLDLRSLAVYRIGLALILLVDLFIRFGDLRAHYTDEGLLPREALTTADRGLSIHVLSGSAWFEATLFAVAAVAAVALLLGLRTRLATFVSWLLLLSLQSRNPIILQGGDVLLRLLLFWGMFLPLGARWSVDSIASRRGDGPSRIVSLAGVALLLQICLMYWCSVVLKSDASWRTEGTAIYYALNIDQLVTPLGHYLLNFPRLLRFLTFATLALEVVGPLLLFCPFYNGRVRLAVVLGFIAFHLFGLGLCLELGPFPYVCSVAWLALMPGCFWDYLARHLSLAAVRYPRSAIPSRLSSWSEGGERTADGRWRLTDSAQRIVVAGALIYVLLWNARTLDFARVSKLFPTSINAIGFALGLDQYWSMFSPMPLKDDGWYVIEGDLRNGDKVDLFRGGAPLRWEKPESVADTYANERWRKYGTNVCQKDYARYRIHYARYLARQWNAQHDQDSQLTSVKIYFMLEQTLPNYEPPKVEKLLLQEYTCPTP
jgi:hypothetical protein